MAKPGKMTPEEKAEREKREREFYELLKKRQARDEELERERKRPTAS
jgi:hypothetical protein